LFGLFQIIFPLFFILFAVLFVTAVINNIIRTGKNASNFIKNRESFDDVTEDDLRPKSLSGGDSLYLPMIRRDFPDFDISHAKNVVSSRVRDELTSFDDVVIHKTVISGYKSSPLEYVVEFQTAAQYTEERRSVQKRFGCSYTFSVAGGNALASAVCPSCGAPIKKHNAGTCEYCECRLVNIFDSVWEITEFCEL